jgi:uncharacterized protein involved in tolerance to divalent cations
MKLIKLLILLSIIACSRYEKEDKPSAAMLQEEDNKNSSQYPDSLFFKKSLDKFVFSEINKGSDKQRLHSVDNVLRDQLEGCLNISTQIISAYYYSKYKNLDDFDIIVLLVNTTSSKHLVMVSVKDKEIINCLQLTEDHCDLVNWTEEVEEIWCDTKEAYRLENNNLQVIKKHIVTMDYGDKASSTIDSVTLIYSINDEGYLKAVNKDSLRIVR